MKRSKIKRGFILPSAAFTITSRQVKFFCDAGKKPIAGDVVYGEVRVIGQHSSLENKVGRIHIIHNGTRAVFVFGNRYAPDFYEGLIPEDMQESVDLLSRSGIVGCVTAKNSLIKDPTKIHIMGYVCEENGRVINTLSYPLIQPKIHKKVYPRSKMILVCGTSMNSGKSVAAAACCWALNALAYKVRGSKITGTASLKDILHMNDAGAKIYSDFTYLGYPSTYQLDLNELFHIFDTLDLRYGNNPNNFWIVELADGINQRETAALLHSERLKTRIHRLIFCAADALGAIGGLKLLKENYNLIPDAISGICTSSPLHIREVSEFTDIPVFDSVNVDIGLLKRILISENTESVKKAASMVRNNRL